MKVIIIKAFSKLSPDGKMTAINFEQTFVNIERVFNHFIGVDVEQQGKYSMMTIFQSSANRL